MRLALILVAAVLLSAGALQSASLDDAVRTAIVRAVEAKLEVNAAVHVDDIDARGNLDRPFVAQVPAGARMGTRVRFVLVAADASGERLGEADATVSVSARHFRATRAIRRGATIADDAAVAEDGDLGSIPIQPLPGRDGIVGALAARDITSGEVLIAAMVKAPVIVKSGDKIVARRAAGPVYAQAVVVAAQSGGVGDVIRCVNPETRKAMAVRIVGAGVAEVIHAF